MRIRIGIILAYLLLVCILVEDALPYFAESNTMEMCEFKSESESNELQKEKEQGSDWKDFREKVLAPDLMAYASWIHPGSLFADSEMIPDSAHQSIFSPPPNKV